MRERTGWGGGWGSRAEASETVVTSVGEGLEVMERLKVWNLDLQFGVT